MTQLPEVPGNDIELALTELKKQRLAEASELKRQVLGALKQKEPGPDTLQGRDAARRNAIIEGSDRYWAKQKQY